MKYYCPRCKEKYENENQLLCSKCGFQLAAYRFEKKSKFKLFRFYKTSRKKPARLNVKVIAIAASVIVVLGAGFFVGRYFITKPAVSETVAEVSTEVSAEIPKEAGVSIVSEETAAPSKTAETPVKTEAAETPEKSKKSKKSEKKEKKEKKEKAVSSEKTETASEKSVRKPAFLTKIKGFGATVAETVFTRGECMAGTVGKGGGVIFYDKMKYSDGWRYLEVARTDMKGTSWGRIDKQGQTQDEIGNGDRNTYSIIANFGENTAAYVVSTYGNTEDWYLGNNKEMLLLYCVLTGDEEKAKENFDRNTQRKIKKASESFNQKIGEVKNFSKLNQSYNYWTSTYSAVWTNEKAENKRCAINLEKGELHWDTDNSHRAMLRAIRKY